MIPQLSIRERLRQSWQRYKRGESPPCALFDWVAGMIIPGWERSNFHEMITQWQEQWFLATDPAEKKAIARRVRGACFFRVVKYASLWVLYDAIRGEFRNGTDFFK